MKNTTVKLQERNKKNSKITGVDENKDTNLTGMNDPSLDITHNNKIPVVDPEMFENNTKEELIK